MINTYQKKEWNQTILLQPQSGVAGGIVSSSAYSAGNLPLNGSLIVDESYNTAFPQWITWVCGGNESANSITISGFDSSLRTFSFTQIGVNSGTVTIEIPYSRITSISLQNNASGAMSIGTSSLTSTCWMPLDNARANFNVNLTCTVSTGGSMTYTAQTSQDDLANGYPPINTQDDVTMNNLTSSGVTDFDSSTKWVRVIFNSFTSGTLLVQLTQAGYPVSNKYN